MSVNSINGTKMPSHVCYEAHWRNQSVFISAPCQSAMEWQWHCLASAILLERLEDACVLAETLLESSLQFFVSELPKSKNRSESRIRDYLKVVYTNNDEEVEIWLPSRAYHAAMRHAELIEQSNLTWSTVPASLKIAQIFLNADDSSRLAKGSLLLIPSSWQPKWVCSVIVPQLDSHFTAVIDAASGTLILDTAESPPPENPINFSTDTFIDAFLETDISINPSELLSLKAGDDDKSTTDSQYSVALNQATCQCRVNFSNYFKADLLPIGDGYGLYVKEYH